MYDFEKQEFVEPPRQFTGVWIPKEILLDPELNATDKILYAEISSFGDVGCWKKAEELQRLCGTGRDGLRAACKRLRDAGYIVESRRVGRMVRFSTLNFSACSTNGMTQRTDSPGVPKPDSPGVPKPDSPGVLKDNTKEYTIDNTNTAASAAGRLMKANRKDDEISKLYYEAVKSLALPVTNHNTIWRKIAEMRKTYPEHISIQYLTFMRDGYAKWETRFKPSVNSALDIYTKSRQIMTRLHEDSKAQEVF